MKEGIRKHDGKQIIEAIEYRKKSEASKTKIMLRKGRLISIMEDGTHIHDKYQTVKRCVEFFEELCSSKRALADQDSNGDPTTTSTIDPPFILPSEVEASIKRQQSAGRG